MVYTLQELPFVVAAAKDCEVPVFYRDQGAPVSGTVVGDWKEVELPRLLGNGITAVFPTTHARSQELVRRGCDPKRVRHVRLGVPVPECGDVEQARNRARDAWGFPAGSVVVGLFGRLIEWKGQEVLIRAIEKLPESIRAVIVGGPQLNKDGEAYVAYLERMIVERGLCKRVIMTGFRKDVAELMTGCDIVCHTSTKEPFGLVIVEAMMAGRPVIATDVSGPRESVVDKETGLLYEPGNADALASCILALTNDRSLRHRMGIHGRDRAVQLFGVDRNQRDLDQAVADCLCRR